MGRELTSHKVDGLNDRLAVTVLDEPGQGNACHHYQIATPSGPLKEMRSGVCCEIQFQNGPIGEVGANGISNEALLAIVEDRLVGFQSGTYSCDENENALQFVRHAMAWLRKRTTDRIARGVEGTHQV